MNHFYLLLVLVVAGCAGISATESFREYGLRRAVFELNCPAEQLKTATLSDGAANGLLQCTGAQVGVRGCGKQAVYRCSPNQEWRAEPSGQMPN
jgi:hypothetical protein